MAIATPGPDRDPPSAAEIPTRVTRLRDLGDTVPDQIAPLAALAILIALLGTTCIPLWTATMMLADPATAVAPAPADEVLGPTMQPAPATQPAVVPIPRITLIGVLVFFGIAVLGMVGGFATIFRREWGRKLLLAYAALVLIYLAAAVYMRLYWGIEGLTGTAPTRSALTLNLTCSLGVIVVVAGVMVMILRYFTLPHIARRFR